MKESKKEKEERLKMIAENIKESNIRLPDIREREWLKYPSKVSITLKKFIELENLLIELDEYQMENNQCYPQFEDMMLKIGELREEFTNLVDSDISLIKY